MTGGSRQRLLDIEEKILLLSQDCFWWARFVYASPDSVKSQPIDFLVSLLLNLPLSKKAGDPRTSAIGFEHTLGNITSPSTLSPADPLAH